MSRYTSGTEIDQAKEIERLQAEVALLRKALQKIVDTSPIDFNYDANEVANHQWNLALAALAATEAKP